MKVGEVSKVNTVWPSSLARRSVNDSTLGFREAWPTRTRDGLHRQLDTNGNIMKIPKGIMNMYRNIDIHVVSIYSQTTLI